MMTEPNFYPEDTVIGKSNNGKIRYALIEKTFDMESDDDSDSDMDDYDDNNLEPGFVRLAWYPEGVVEDVRETQIQLVDRSTLPRDVVREKNGKQLGTVLDVDVHCDVSIVGTNKKLKNIHSKDLKHIHPLLEGDFVAYGPWVGNISKAAGFLVLKFSNGARGRLSLADDGCDQLEDLYPHPSDEGMFCDSEFYPGQVLAGPPKAFSNIEWCAGTVSPPLLKHKSRIKVFLEQLELHSVNVKWVQRAFSSSTVEEQRKIGEDSKLGLSANPAEPPPYLIEGVRLQYLKRLLYFWPGHLVLGLRLSYELTPEDVEQLKLQPKAQPRLKRNRRVFSTRRLDRKMARMSASGSSNSSSSSRKISEAPKRSSKNRETEEIIEDSDEDISNPEVDHPEEIVDAPGGDHDDKDGGAAKDGILEPKIPYPKSFTCQLGEFSLNFSSTGKQGLLYMQLENSKYSQKTLKQLRDKVTSELSALEKQHSSCGGGESSERQKKMVAKMLELVRDMVRQLDPAQVDGNIEYEYLVGDTTVSGFMDKAGKQVEVTFSGESDEKKDENQNPPIEGCAVAIQAPEKGESFQCITGPVAKRQAGPKVEFQPGQMVTIEVICTRTNADIEWQDGSVSRSIPSTEVRQAHHIDDNDFCPGDFVFDERNSGDMHLYGLVLSADNANRMATVQWFRQDATNNKVLTLNKEELSVYEVADHPGFHFRISDIIIRVSSISDEDHEEQQLIGELLQVNRNGKLKVLWSDGSQSEVFPQEVMPISPDEESFQDSSSGDEESGSDESWETAASDVDEQTVMEEIMEECIAATVDAVDGVDAGGAVRDENEVGSGEDRAEQEATTTQNEDEATEVENTATETEEFVGGSFSQDECVPNSHSHIATEWKQPCKKYTAALHKDLKLLRSALPAGIHVKSFEDRMDLFVVLIEGPLKTPYENGLFLFHVQLPGEYPSVPPNIRYISFSPRLNPNLYEDGKVCISLLGTWSGKGSEKWTEESNLLQLLVSIQGLILNSEPYYNEAGYEGHRGTAEGKKNSRCYNEMVLLRLVQHMTLFVSGKHPTFGDLIHDYCNRNLPLLVRRVRALLRFNETQTDLAAALENNSNVEGTSSGESVTATIKVTAERSQETEHNLDYPLLPLSKGVIMSLGQKLDLMVSAATRVGLYKE